MRFAGRSSGLAFGLALAVRPAGAAEVSGVNGAPQARPACGMRSTVEAGGADPDNARRSAPGDYDLSGNGTTRVSLAAWSSWPGAALGRYGGHRMRPVTGGTGRGSSARRRASARRARRKLPHRPRRSPALTPAACGWPLLATHPSPLLAASASRGCSRPGRQARRAGGAPLKP